MASVIEEIPIDSADVAKMDVVEPDVPAAAPPENMAEFGFFKKTTTW